MQEMLNYNIHKQYTNIAPQCGAKTATFL
jgi:hypothetical protein